MKVMGWVSFLAAAALSACGQPETAVGNPGGASPTPTPGSSSQEPTATPTPTPAGLQLASGNYSYAITQVPTNTCWEAPKNIPAVPSTTTVAVAVAGSTVTVDLTLQGTAESYALTLKDAALSGAGSGTVDLSPDGVDCQLAVSATLTGVVTADNAFTTSQVINIAEQSGTQCNLAVGTIETDQLSALPCSLTMNGSATGG